MLSTDSVARQNVLGSASDDSPDAFSGRLPAPYGRRLSANSAAGAASAAAEPFAQPGSIESFDSGDDASPMAHQPLISPFSAVQHGLPGIYSGNGFAAELLPPFPASGNSSPERPRVSLRTAYGGSSNLGDGSPTIGAHLDAPSQPPRRVSFATAAKNPLWVVDGPSGDPGGSDQSSEFWRVPPPAARSSPVMLKQNSVLPLPAGATMPLRMVCYPCRLHAFIKLLHS